LIDLAQAKEQIGLMIQTRADVDYLAGNCKRVFTAAEMDLLYTGLLRAVV